MTFTNEELLMPWDYPVHTNPDGTQVLVAVQRDRVFKVSGAVHIGKRVEIWGDVVVDGRSGKVHIGDSVVIRGVTTIESGVVIGSRTTLGGCVVVKAGVTIGEECKVGWGLCIDTNMPDNTCARRRFPFFSKKWRLSQR